MVTRLSTSQWLERAHATHGDRFDYSAATYVNNSVNVTIICRTHGPFEQKPGSHTAGAIGCNGCKPVVVGRPAMSAEAFIVRARELYGDRFDYTATRYVNAKTTVLIGCDSHGQVPVLPKNFLHRPTGCPRCVRASALHAARGHRPDGPGGGRSHGPLGWPPADEHRRLHRPRPAGARKRLRLHPDSLR